jgi:hypothetical protein
MTIYTWVLTPYSVRLDQTSQSLKVGPSGAHDRLRIDLVIKSGEQFRLVGASGEPLFSGYILGQYTGTEPLEEYGRRHGCHGIHYFRDGRWISLPGERN